MNQFEPQPPKEKKRHPSEMLGDLLHTQSEEINARVSSDRLSGDLLTMDASLDPAGYADMYTEEELEADAKFVRERELEWADFYRDKPGIKNEDDMIRKWQEDKTRQKSGQMEMAVTALLSQMLGEDFIVVRTAPYDDYKNGVDNLIVNKATKEVIGAFDEVHGSARVEDKRDKILRIAKKGGAEIRYGLGFKRKSLKREKLANIPVFYLGLEEEELAELVDGLGKNDMTKKDKIFRKLLASLVEQQQELREVATTAGATILLSKLRSFGHTLAELQAKSS